MAKFKIRKKQTPKEILKAEAKKVNWGLIVLTLISICGIFTIYQAALRCEFEYIVHIYGILAAVLALGFAVLNRGFSRKKLTVDELPENWDAQRKQSFMRKEEKRRKLAKYLLIPLVGIMISFAYDVVYLFYLEPLL